MVFPAPSSHVDDPGPGFRAFFEASPVGQLLLDTGRRVRSANPAAVRIFSSPAVDPVGRPFEDLVEPASAPALDRAFRAAGGDGTSGPTSVQCRTADGSTFLVEVTVLRLRAGRGEWFGVIARDSRAAPAGQTSVPPGARTPTPPYAATELLMANRLRELV